MQQKSGRNRSDSRGVAIRTALKTRLASEDGALLPLALMMFVFMMCVTGLAIDFVREEEMRTKIQNTLDRAVLAATSLSQDLDPVEVVSDYLNKAGLGAVAVNTVVQQGTNMEWRQVTATTDDSINTMFGKLVGINTLGVSGNSQAREEIGNVEISLVLDISGSMNDTVTVNGKSTTRIAALRSAATTFVGKMFDSVQGPDVPAGRLSISVVPYNQQVSLGSTTAAGFTLSSDHTQNTCADVEMLSTSSLAISPSTTLQRTMYGDSFNYSGQLALTGTAWSVSQTTNVKNCPEYSYASVLAWANDKTKINSKINVLSAAGDTGIDIGARWGLALLDPSTQPALTTLINKGSVDTALAGRPFNYASTSSTQEDSAMKVMVLMTDGQNTRSYSTKAAYRTGNSGFYSTKSATTFSTSTYASWGSTSDWASLYYYDSTKRMYYSMNGKSWSTSVSGTLYPITWQTIWGKNYTLQYVAQTFLYPPWHSVDTSVTKQSAYDTMAIKSEFDGKDTALNDLCTVAKDSSHDIYIFTVAVDAPSDGAAILKKCATNAGYAYDVDSNDLSTAFNSIASSINALRLTN